MNKHFYLELRIIIIIIISIIIIILDVKLNIFFKIKSYASSSVDLLYCMYDKPCFVLNIISKTFEEYKNIILENYALRQELLLKKSDLLLLDQYKQENFRLRKLINFSSSYNTKKIIARIIFINTNPWDHQIVINKGKKDNVYIGQPIITEKGVVGQVISISAFNSHILLIYDINHALSVQIKRNNHRMILIGCGRNMQLHAECPINIDVCIGDILVTSGLDGRFPEGYPVATVLNVIKNKTQDLLIIQASPTVNFQNLHDVLLIWP